MMDGQRSEADMYMRQQAETGARIKVVVGAAFAIPLSLALAIPMFRALWEAVDSIPDGVYPVLGVVTVGGLIMLLLLAATLAAFTWIRRPGNQLPASFAPIERWAEGGE